MKNYIEKDFLFKSTIISFILLSSLGFISTDIYIVSLPLLVHELNTTPLLIQYTITIYFFGLAFSQIVYIFLANRCSINSLIYFSLLFYILSCFFCYFSTTVWQLIFSRFLQAFFSCSGMIFGRTIIATVYNEKNAAKVFAKVYPFVGISPAVMPIIGGYITQVINWRFNFLVLSVLGMITLLMYRFYVPKVENKAILNLSILDQMKSCYRALANPIFRYGIALICLADGAYFSYVLKAPFLLHDYNFTTITMSFFFIPTAVSFFIGNHVCSKLLVKRTLLNVINVGVLFFFFATILLFLLKILLKRGDLVAYIIPLCLLTFSNGFIIPLATTLGINAEPDLKNISSGFLGFLQFSITFVATLISNNFSYIYLPVLLLFLGIFMIFSCCQLNSAFYKRQNKLSRN